MARAIVADREAKGPFLSLAGLDRVPGIGPKLLAVLGPHLTFKAGASMEQVRRDPACPAGPSDCQQNLNTLSAAQLEALPGIGPTLAARIIAYRESHGGFADIGELRAVSGVGPALAERLKPLLTVR